MQMPLGIRQHVEQIHAYAAMIAAEAHSSQAKQLVALLHGSADDLEITARHVFTALGLAPAPAPLNSLALVLDSLQLLGDLSFQAAKPAAVAEQLAASASVVNLVAAAVRSAR